MSKKRIIIIIAVIVIVGLGACFFILAQKPKVEYTTTQVKRGDLIQTVSETGTVKSAKGIELNFLNSGKIAKLAVKIGDKIKKDQLLAELDLSSLLLKVKEAQANLEINRANLNKLIAGASAQEKAVSQASEEQARQSYQNANQELEKTKNKINENIRQAEKALSDLESKTDNDITTYEQAVDTAQTSLDNTKSTYLRSIDNNKTNALNTIDSKNAVAQTALDNINTILLDDDAKNYLSIKNIIYLNLTKSDYLEAVRLLVTANADLSQAKANLNDQLIETVLANSLVVLNKTFTALTNCYSALENSVVAASFTQTELDTYKTNIATQKTNISTGISSVQSAQQTFDDAILAYQTNVSNAEKSLADAQAKLDNAIVTAGNALATAQTTGAEQLTQAQNKVDAAYQAWQVALAQLNKIKTPARPEDISLAQAQVSQAQAVLDLAKNQIDNSIIKAPIDGTITKKNYEVGEQTQVTKAVYLMLAENNFEIELDVAEADIAKIKINNPTEITLDAFGDEVKFKGSVYFVEPAETIIQDVVYYKVKINFDGSGQTIKSGMTANVIITTQKKDNVLIIPSRAVTEKNHQGKFVKILTNSKVKEVPVTVGLRGDEGLIEVISGLNQGDQAITYIKEKK